MKTTAYGLILFGFISPLYATTPIPTPTVTATAAAIVFNPIDDKPYGPQAAVSRAVFPMTQGSGQVFVDKVVDSQAESNNETYYMIQLHQDGRSEPRERVFDNMAVTLLPDSGVRTFQYSKYVFQQVAEKDVVQNGVHHMKRMKHHPGQEVDLKGQVQFSRVILIFQQGQAAYPYRIFFTSPGGGYPAISNLACDRYEFVPAGDGVNENLVAYSRTGFPTTWVFSSPVTQDQKDPDRLPEVTSIPPDPGFYPSYQAQLEAKVSAPTLNPVEAYLDHMELSWLYDGAGQPVTDISGQQGEKARQQRAAATAIQPQYPLINPGPGFKNLAPFVFVREVPIGVGSNGDYGFKTYEMGSSGKAVPRSKDLKDWDQILEMLKKSGGNNSPALPYSGPTDYFRVDLDTETNYSGSNFPLLYLNVVDKGAKQAVEIPIPETGRPEGLGWNPKTDKYYFFVSTGSNPYQSVAEGDLWQFIPSRGELKKIGFSDHNIFISPDGRWLIWGNGGRYMENSFVTGFNAFDTQKGVSYRLTQGFEPQCFIGWKN